jgi:hypothetical protein
VAGLLVVAITVAGLYLTDPAAEEGDSASPESTGPAPTTYSDAPSTDVFKGIDRRAGDQRALDVPEVFGRSTKRLSDDDADVVLELRASKIDANCGAAVWSRALATELRRAGCSQIVRGLYSDDKGKFAVVVAIVNLADVTQANAIVRRLSPQAGTGFVLPLTGEPPLDRFGQGFSIARGRAMGHYGLISWAQRLDGTGDEQDEDLLSLVVTGGRVDEALLRRAVSGR